MKILWVFGITLAIASTLILAGLHTRHSAMGKSALVVVDDSDDSRQLPAILNRMNLALSAQEAMIARLDRDLRMMAINDAAAAAAAVSGSGDVISREEHERIVKYLMDKYWTTVDQVKSLVLLSKATLAREPNPRALAKTSSWFKAPYAPPDECRQGVPRLTVATLNLWNLNPPWEERLRRMAAVLRRWDVDVVGLQEIRFTDDGVSQLDQLHTLVADTFPYREYIPVRKEAKGREEGIGVTRLPFLTFCCSLFLENSLSPAFHSAPRAILCFSHGKVADRSPERRSVSPSRYPDLVLLTSW